MAKAFLWQMGAMGSWMCAAKKEPMKYSERVSQRMQPPLADPAPQSGAMGGVARETRPMNRTRAADSATRRSLEGQLA